MHDAADAGFVLDHRETCPDRATLPAVTFDEDKPDRMWLLYAIENLLAEASITAAIASVAPEDERADRIKAAEKALAHALQQLIAPPDYALPPRPLWQFQTN
jgi:hypothetical protein